MNPDLTAVKGKQQLAWAAGDYAVIGTTLQIVGESLCEALDLRAAAAPFSHGAVHEVGTVKFYDSYHCSRYNTNTGVLTPAMFESVFAKVRADLG